MKRNAVFHLPGLFEFYELYRRFLPLYRNHPEYFYDWCDIGSIYGAPADCLWGGIRFLQMAQKQIRMENHAAIPAIVQHLAERIAARITQMLRAQEGVAERQPRGNAVIAHQRQHIPRA